MRFPFTLSLLLLALAHSSSAQPSVRWQTSSPEISRVDQQIAHFVAQEQSNRNAEYETKGPVDVLLFWEGVVAGKELKILHITENDTLQDGTLQHFQSPRVNGLAFLVHLDEWRIETLLSYHDIPLYLSHWYELLPPDSLNSTDTIGLTIYTTNKGYHCDEAEEESDSVSHEPWRCTTRETRYYYVTPTGSIKQIR